MIALSRLHYPVTSLGPGRRIGIWTQGCSIGCRGCVSRDTWEASAEHLVEEGGILEWLMSIDPAGVDGITVTGGEPFDQPEALLKLLEILRSWKKTIPREIDILLFSGYTLGALVRSQPEALGLIDAIVAGPYREDLPTDLIWRGSANQRLKPMSSLGKKRYAGFLECRPRRPPMQVSTYAGSIWWIGIPRRGEMERVSRELVERGIVSEGHSW